MFKKNICRGIIGIITAAALLAGCGSVKDILDKSDSSVISKVAETVTGGDEAVSETESVTLTDTYASADAADAISELFTKRDLSGDYDESESVKITLSGKSAETDAKSGISIEDGLITISEEGTYILSGSYEGMIKINTGDSDKVQLVLDNASITNNDSAVIYVLNADKVFITLADGSTNTLSHSGSYTTYDDNNIDGVIFAKDDITINGTGSLTVSADTGNGIVSKDDIKIASGDITVNAAHHGIEGKDSVRIAGGTISITSGEDGIHSDNDEDEDKGYVYIAGGDITISAGDDGVHAENTTTVAAGKLNIVKSYEGLEGNVVNITGGEIYITSSDDGINAAGGDDGSGFGTENQDTFGGRGFGMMMDADESAYINISGGYIEVNASGDGLDSNGYLVITGGEIYVSGPESNADGALDTGISSSISGGTVVAVGSSGMAENFGDDSTQGAIMVNTSSNMSAGTEVTLKDSDGNVLLSYTAKSSFNNIVVSHPDIKEGETYTITADDESFEVTMDSLIYGESSGMGGFGGRGGFGGNMNGNGNFEPNGERPEMPEGFEPNGERPEMPEGAFKNGEMPQMPDGEIPEGFDQKGGGRGGFGKNRGDFNPPQQQ